MALTDTFVKNAKPDASRAAGIKHTDGQGLYLLVKPAGKYWRMDYRHAGKRKTLAVEVRYGDVPWEVGWPRVEDALVRLMLPKLQEILERERAHPELEVQQAAPVEGGIA